MSHIFLHDHHVPPTQQHVHVFRNSTFVVSFYTDALLVMDVLPTNPSTPMHHSSTYNSKREVTPNRNSASDLPVSPLTTHHSPLTTYHSLLTIVALPELPAINLLHPSSLNVLDGGDDA